MQFSIIIPVYNRPQEVDELLGSLCRQTFKDFEVVVVEDGSTEKCDTVCQSYADRLPVNYHFKPNSGPGPSRNYGAERSQGDYLIILDSDVIVPDDYLETIKQELDTYAEGFSIKWPNDIYRDGRKIAGILIENDFMDQSIRKSIVGVGININQDIFRGTAPNPVSLSQITGREVPLSPLLSGIMRRIASLYDRLKTGESETIAQAYTASVFRKEGMHRYKDADGDFEAVFVKVESDGRLFLQDSCGQLRNYLFKQVEYIL